MRCECLRRAAFRVAAAVVLSFAVAGAAFAQAPITGRETSPESVASYPLSQSMPIDPEVVVGRLPNGLKYYIRQNAKPARRVELRLVVKAGSVLEDDDQLGLAHFVEHMLFEGTKHFPGKEVVEFIESLGLSIGADANAATSYDETAYTLRVPSDVPGALDKAMLVLEDWAQAATFDQAGIDRERGIVLEEWRMRLGADDRLQDKLLRSQLEGSRYADRKPIGTPEVLQKATRDQLVRFYRDWYRPNLMAVIVVGDLNKVEAEAMIRSHFTGLVNPTPSRPRPIFDVPERPDTRFVIATDKETTTTAVRVSNLRPARNQGTVGGYREIMLDQLFSQMLGDRLDELSQSNNPPFLRAAAARGLFQSPRTRDESVLQALVANSGVGRGLDALVTELARVEKFGFTQSELDRAKLANMRGSERVVAESPDRESDSRADEYTRNFLQDEALPTIWQELAFHRRFLPAVTLAEVNALAHDWFPESNRLVLVAAPDARGVVLPTQTQLAAVLSDAAAKRLEAYVDSGAGQSLMDAPPKGGTIVRTTTRGGGVTEWTLSNGATVVLQPTELRADQVLFRAFAMGGTSLASDADFLSARIADDVITASGVGKFTGTELDKVLSGRALAVRPFINETRQGMGGGASPDDLEAMFQLLHLRFTQPRADASAFGALKQQALAMLDNQAASPDFVFGDAIDSTLNGNHPRRRPETPATVGQWNLDTALAFYKARFADASNFTFVFVGSFTPQSIRPLVETYIASLPATRSRERFRDVGVTPPTGVVERTVKKGIAPRSEVEVVFHGAFDYDEPNRIALKTVVLLLQSRLNEAIREQLGGTYSITSEPEMAKYPKPEYRIKINFACDPARVDALVQRVFEEIAFIKRQTFQPEQMDRIREILIRDLEKNSEENGYLLGELSRRYEDGNMETSLVGGERAQIGLLTGYALQQAAQKYLNTGNYVKVVLNPEQP